MKFLIDFKADALDADISAYLQQHSCTVLKEWNNFDQSVITDWDNTARYGHKAKYFINSNL